MNNKEIEIEDVVKYINMSPVSSIVYDSSSEKNLRYILNNFNIIEINNYSREFNIKQLVRNIKLDILLNNKDYMVKKKYLIYL